jgi:hypothetical protein
MTKSPFTTPSVAFGLASSTATASGTHQRISRSSINYLKNMPDPKNSTRVRSSPRGNPRTLCSPAEHGQDLNSQTPVGTAAVRSRCTTLPTSTPPVRPLDVKIIPPRATTMACVVGVEDGHNSRVGFTAYFMAKTARTRRGTAQKRRPPGTGCPGRNPPTTQELSPTHINTTSHNHTTTTPLNIHLTTHTNTIRRYKLYLPRSILRTRISQTSTTQITPKHLSKKTLLISRILESFT